MGFLDSIIGKKKSNSSEVVNSDVSFGEKVLTDKNDDKVKSNRVVSKRWTKPVSLETLFKKSVSFHVERYEEWLGGKCISKDSISFDIHLIADADKILVSIPYANKLRMHNKVAFYFENSQILSDRIQYVNPPFNNTDSTQPIVLHIFLKANAIEYIRFAMSFPDRIVELYGYQIESDSSKSETFNTVTCKTTSNNDYKLTFLSSLINVAACDGDISEEEMKTILAIISREGMSHSDFLKVINSPSSIPQVIPDSAQLRAQHLRDVVGLSMVDGFFDPREYALCKQIASGLGFRPEVIDVIRKEYNDKLGSNI